MSAEGPVIRPLDRSHGGALLEINRGSPIVADFSFVFDRAPDFFAWPDLLFDDYRYAGVFQDGRLVGYCLTGLATGWVGEATGSFFYLGDARILPEARGRRLAEGIGYWLLERVLPDAPIGWGLVKEGNEPAEHILSTVEQDLVRIERLCSFEAVSILMLRRGKGPVRFPVRRAGQEDMGAAIDLANRCHEGRLFAPTFSSRSLEGDELFVAEEDGRIVGLAIIRDIDPVKRTLLLRYSLKGRMLRAAYSVGARVFRGGPPLPVPGQAFRTLTIRHVAIEGGRPEVLQDLLAFLVRGGVERGYHMVNIGFCGEDPLRQATGPFIVNRFRSSIFMFRRLSASSGEPQGSSDPSIDLAMI